MSKKIIVRKDTPEKKDEESWTDDDYVRWFEKHNSDFWFSLSTDKDITTPAERRLLYTLGKISEKGKLPSFKQLQWAKRIIDNSSKKADLIQKDQNFEKAAKQLNISEKRHLTVRMAWHNDGWDGRICSDPKKNEYCIGENSLLSRRIRENRNVDFESQNSRKLPNINNPSRYVPPCYWSINAFGKENIQIEHEHPLLGNPNIKGTPNIPDVLPAYTVFTWPFKLSFVIDKDLKDIDGKYPKNLEPKIDRFLSKLQPQISLIFLYCNYDNPISADERKYLLVGCGLLKQISNKTYFDIPDAKLEKIREKKGYQNFPKINWALKLCLDEQNIAKIPYHEYLAEAERSNNYDLLEEIKITVDEPELIPSFKYVAMDIDDDQAIFLLTKFKQSFLKIKEHGRVSPHDIERSLSCIENFLKLAWQKRGLFPGFARLSRILLNRADDIKPLALDDLIPRIMEEKGEDYYDDFLKFIDNPHSNSRWRKLVEDEICDLKTNLATMKIDTHKFLSLCMLNLTLNQFRRIIRGEIGDFKRSISDIFHNPYLLCEEYDFNPEKGDDDPITGDRIDSPIDLSKIDIAYFPDIRYLKRYPKLQNFKPSDPQRVRALVISYLKGLEGVGNCFDEGHAIEKYLKDYPLFYQTDYFLPENILAIPDQTTRDHLCQKLVIITHGAKHYYYLKEVYQAEQYIANTIKSLLNMPDLPCCYEIDYEADALELTNRLQTNFDSAEFKRERKKLYENVFNNRIFILSGSPGTGKSYELLRIANELQHAGEDYLILTPTGKAALRLSLNEEGIKGIKAQTIDKFIFNNRAAPDESIVIENLIIDEMSMVDLLKFNELLRKFNFKSSKLRRLILVGDQHQLPPIGFGKVFIDIIRYVLGNDKHASNYVSLDVNCRQKLDDTVVRFAKIFSGLTKHYEPLLKKVVQGGEISQGLSIIFWNDREELRGKIIKRFVELFGGRKDKEMSALLNDVFNLRDDGYVKNDKAHFKDTLKLDKFQMLTPYRANYYGTLGLNNYFQETFRGTQRLIGGDLTFRHSEKIIQIQNLYSYQDLILSNGSIGVAVNDYRKTFYFPECEAPLARNELRSDDLEMAYAITVHKAQGSGFEHVFFILPARKALLSRELIYTALTRSKQGISVFIYGEPAESVEGSILNFIVHNSAVLLRKTSLLGQPIWEYTLSPAAGVNVKSRAEYIIFKKLQECKQELGEYDFEYEKIYPLPSRGFNIKPDFTITLMNGKKIYWEHLGKLGNRSYERDWAERLKN